MVLRRAAKKDDGTVTRVREFKSATSLKLEQLELKHNADLAALRTRIDSLELRLRALEQRGP